MPPLWAHRAPGRIVVVTAKFAQGGEIRGDAMLNMDHLNHAANARPTKMSNAVEKEKLSPPSSAETRVCPMLDIIGLCGPSQSDL